MDKSTRILVAAEKDQELLNFHEDLKSTRKLVASGNLDIDGTGEKNCVANSNVISEYARQFAQGYWSFLGLGSEKKSYETHVYKPNGERDDVADIMMINFSESGHSVFRGSNAFERGDLKSERKGRSSIQFNGCDETIEVIIRTVISVNHLCVCGAVAEMCKELAWETSKKIDEYGETRSA